MARERLFRPVLVDRCIGCHRDGREEAGLNMSTMTEILEGAGQLRPELELVAELGLDSPKAHRLIADLEDELDIEISDEELEAVALESKKTIEIDEFVPKDEIAANDYDLSINRYKEVEYEAAEYDPPKEILARLADLEEEIAKARADLEALLG